MMSKVFLKQFGILGVALGLTASPLVIADTHDTGAPADPAGTSDPASPGTQDPASPGTDPAEMEEGTADPATGDPGTGDEPEATMPDEEEAGFGDGGEAMPGEAEPPAEHSGEPLPEDEEFD
ncbi:hypothetical protein IEI94_03350 [Halomonas sp. ML-15]|uniref:hypothetical protein n=1 Tax=Halomonas sp. ML-15 TaxID=2773305 RepID=UPI001746F3CD|nr:hypothetical protein [Halomonas sp. ML-15]MBD3894887.1 hypothetical protein [Halomonas sp. ML-15]